MPNSLSAAYYNFQHTVLLWQVVPKIAILHDYLIGQSKQIIFGPKIFCLYLREFNVQEAYTGTSTVHKIGNLMHT